MKIISTSAALAEFGIEPLTGEACSLMYRILCDLTAKGKDYVSSCTSLVLSHGILGNRR